MEYVPILKWKRGERTALENLRAHERQQIRPLLEIVPRAVQPKEESKAGEEVPDDDDLDAPEQGPLLEGLEQDRSGMLVKDVIAAWGTSPVFVDFGLLDPKWRPSSGRHPVTHFFEEAKHVGQQWIPVVKMNADSAYQTAVAGVVEGGAAGVCIRARLQDVFEESFPGAVERLYKKLNVPPANVDLLVDAGRLPDDHLPMLRAGAQGAMLTIPRLKEWRTLIFASNAFPDTLQGLPPGKSTVPREDWRMWCSLRGKATNVRPIVFSDYTAAGTALPDSRNIGSAQIRYTLDEEWLVLKGWKLTDDSRGGHDQFYRLAEELVQDPRFCKADFSWGDRYIDACAQRRVSSGNLGTWRAVATSHHIAFVLAQLAKLAPPG